MYLFVLKRSPIGSIGNFVESEETFESYVGRVDLYIDANGITDDKKVATFLTLAGFKTYELAKSLLSPIKPSASSYASLIKKLNDHYKAKVITYYDYERYKFHSRIQHYNESVSEFVAALR